MPEEQIKRIVADRGFGFIGTERDDIFFHATPVVEVDFAELQEGQTVEYTEGKGPRDDNVWPV